MHAPTNEVTVAGPSAAQDEIRQCIRALVNVIRQAQTGSSPVDSGQMQHMRKVVRLLSLSDEQINAMTPSEREAVLTIRNSAIQKMKLATAVHGACDDGSGGMPPPPMVGVMGNVGNYSAPTEPPIQPPIAPPGASTSNYAISSSAPSAFGGHGAAASGCAPRGPARAPRRASLARPPCASLTPAPPRGRSAGFDASAMPPPSFYVRKQSR